MSLIEYEEKGRWDVRINDKSLNCVVGKNNIFKCDIKLINNKEGVREEASGTER